MDTISRGNAAEAAVVKALVDANIVPYLPFGGGSAIDVIAMIPEDCRLVPIQIKAGWLRNGCVEFNTHSTDHGCGRQSSFGKVDVLAVEVADLRRIYVVPVEPKMPTRGFLRLEPCRNNQRAKVKFAQDYTFERWVGSLRGGADRPVPATLR